MQRRTTALYFSPTGGTRTYVRAVAAAMPHMGGEVDLTRPEERRKVHMFGADDVVVLGVPVYYGRVPEVPGLLDGLQGEETPAVLLAVYGNRLIDDALAELSDLCAARGFRPLAAGAFVAPHTFSAKVAMGRPNAGDLAAAAELGRRAAEKLSGPWCAPELPGNRPYRSFQRAPFYPVGDDTCTRCGCCVGACPVEAIHPAAPRATDGEKCIRCLACVRACPGGQPTGGRPRLCRYSGSFGGGIDQGGQAARAVSVKVNTGGTPWGASCLVIRGTAYDPRSSRKSRGDSLRYRQPERPPRATSLWCRYREKSTGWADWLPLEV